MLLTQIQNLTDASQADDICAELEKRYLGTILKVTHNNLSKFLLCDSIIGNKLYFTDYLTGKSYNFDIYFIMVQKHMLFILQKKHLDNGNVASVKIHTH